MEKEDQVSVFSGVIEEDICLWNKSFYSSAVELTLRKTCKNRAEKGIHVMLVNESL